MKEIILRCDNCGEQVNYGYGDDNREVEGVLLTGYIDTQINIRESHGRSSFPTNNLGFEIEEERPFSERADKGIRLCSPKCFTSYMHDWSEDMLSQWTQRRKDRVKKALKE